MNIWRPNGREVHCQGYEPRCLDLLIKTYNEEDILVNRTDMPEIWYTNAKRNGKRSLYYPDMYIPSKNIIVEVKSEYTLYKSKDAENNPAKFDAVVNNGYNLHLYVFDKKHFLYCKIYTTKYVITISKQRNNTNSQQNYYDIICNFNRATSASNSNTLLSAISLPSL